MLNLYHNLIRFSFEMHERKSARKNNKTIQNSPLFEKKSISKFRGAITFNTHYFDSHTITCTTDTN